MLPVTQLMLNAAGSEFLVALLHDKHAGQGGGAWLLTINPLDYPVPKRNLPKEAEMKYANGLMLISHEIEGLLTNTPTVTRQRWFFEGWESNKPGVRTPAELPWHVDAPELRGA
jgi:hypothetical protein